MYLHVTNGDCAGDLIRAAVPGEVLPWRDVLHEGPVPAGLSLEELAKVRARFGAGRGWGAYEEVLSLFRRRDRQLARFRHFHEVILWFEHDLYDQMQLVQLLAWFSSQPPSTTRLSMICIGEHPEVPDFRGLGNLSAAQLTGLFGTQAPVDAIQLQLADQVWRAFTAPDPTAVRDLSDEDLAPLPFLAPALIRYLEEFPDVRAGLSRTQRAILELVAQDVGTPPELFARCQAREAAPFMGDTTFWQRIDELCAGRHPFLANSGAAVSEAALRDNLGGIRLTLTAAGRAALQTAADWIALNGIDEWRGGAHLVTAGHWRWNPDRHALVARGG